QGLDPRHASTLRRRRRLLFAREREPYRRAGRSRLLHWHRDRRHDHAFLGGAQDRYSRGADRHRCRGAWPNYPLQAAVNGDAKVTLAAMLKQADKASAARRKPWVAQAAAIRGEWYAKYKPMLESSAAPINPARIC